jgi:hypothetical protein
MRTYRADVRRLLSYATDSNGLPVGKALINNQSFEVKLPDNGTGNQTPQTAGVSLVIIYRIPTETLKSVVLYDGLQLKLNGPPSTTTTTQTIRGFYDAANSPVAKLGLLVGSGAKNTTEQVLLNGLPVATNPFFTRDTSSPGSDRAWDGKTWSVGSQMPSALGYGTLQIGTDVRTYGEQVPVQLTHSSATPYDCLATSAIVFSTEVNDADFDGLLDVWETGDLSGTSPTNEPLHEPTSLPSAPKPLPNLKAMDALPNQQDIFIELGFMDTLVAYSTPLGNVPIHTHLPSEAVLNGIADVFQGNQQLGIPVPPPRQNPAKPNDPLISGPIKIHFDVGNRYQSNPNVIKFKRSDLTTSCDAVATGTGFPWDPDGKPTDPNCLARGGERFIESDCPPPSAPPPGYPAITCAFPLFRGVVGWKREFQILKEGAFDSNRRHIFRFVEWAHALGVPRDDNPAIPKSISGASDAGDGGGDFIITLGLWDNSTGTEFLQKSTFVHEFGHTAGLRHSGEQSTPTFASVNCKPTYQSVMNYLFQVRGLIGPTGPRIDYSRQDLQLRAGLTGTTKGDLNEANLTETELRVQVGNDGASYPTRWYAPKAGTLLDNLPNLPQVSTSASTRHCDGSPLSPTTNPADAIEMVRIDGVYPVGRIDWNANGTLDAAPLPVYPQDINFNGDGVGTTLNPAADGNFTGWDDWLHLDLRQVGARRVPGILSLEIARNELPESDPIFGDWGYGDWGYGDWGYGDWGYGDWGYGDWGYGDWGYGDWGYGDDIDEATARSQGPTAHTLSFTTTNQAIIVRFLGPTAGGAISKFELWRSLEAISNTNLPTNLTPNGLAPVAPACTKETPSNPSSPLVCTYTDSSAQNNRNYFYFVMTEFTSTQRTRSELLPARR